MLIIMELLLGTGPIVFAFVADCMVGGECVWRLACDLLFDTAPDGVNTLLVVQSLKDSIASNHKEIEVILQFETANLGVTDNNVRISSIFLSLSFDVTKGFGYRQATWEDSQWPLHVEVLFVGVSRRFGKGLRAVYFTTRSLDTNTFKLAIWLVITRARSNFGASIQRHKAAAITNIDDIGHIIDDHNDGCAGS